MSFFSIERSIREGHTIRLTFDQCGGARWKQQYCCPTTTTSVRLDEQGRQLLLERFGLFELANRLPVEAIEEKTPAYLVGCRRQLEQNRRLPYLTVQSDGENHIIAEHVGMELAH